jgi:hypothetical protein
MPYSSCRGIDILESPDRFENGNQSVALAWLRLLLMNAVRHGQGVERLSLISSAGLLAHPEKNYKHTPHTTGVG